MVQSLLKHFKEFQFLMALQLICHFSRCAICSQSDRSVTQKLLLRQRYSSTTSDLSTTVLFLFEFIGRRIGIWFTCIADLHRDFGLLVEDSVLWLVGTKTRNSDSFENDSDFSEYVEDSGIWLVVDSIL